MIESATSTEVYDVNTASAQWFPRKAVTVSDYKVSRASTFAGTLTMNIDRVANNGGVTPLASAVVAGGTALLPTVFTPDDVAVPHVLDADQGLRFLTTVDATLPEVDEVTVTIAYWERVVATDVIFFDVYGV